MHHVDLPLDLPLQRAMLMEWSTDALRVLSNGSNTKFLLLLKLIHSKEGMRTHEKDRDP